MNAPFAISAGRMGRSAVDLRSGLLFASATVALLGSAVGCGDEDDVADVRVASTPAPTAIALPAVNQALEQALRQQQAGKVKDAVAAYEKAVRLDPKEARAYYGRALAYLAMGHLGLAIADLDLAVLLDPQNAQSYWLRGQVRYSLGRPDGAMGDFDEAIRLDPQQAAPFDNRGNLLYLLGKYQLAIRDFSRAIELDGGNPSFYVNRAETFAAMGLFKFADRDEATAVLLGADPLEVGMRLLAFRSGAGIH